jgi:hypothetical protein
MPLVGAWIVGQGLTAAQGRVLAAPAALTLAQSSLEPIVNEAIARWANAGLSDATLAKLTQVEFFISDLPQADLGKALGDRIYLDFNAAGHGWFIDSTPILNEEFTSAQNSSKMLAIDPRAVDRIDLLSVVEHELGHIAGFDDFGNCTDNLMSDRLDAGVRWMP